MTLGPRPTRHSPCFVCAAFTSIKLRGGAAHHSAWHGIAMIPASTLRNAHACRANETCSYHLQDPPAGIPHSAPNGAHGQARVRRSSGIRHEDELVCSPGCEAQCS
jgi:hypothetical protein